MGRDQTEKIRAFVIDHVTEHASDIVALVAQNFSISRQAAARHLAALVESGILNAKGRTRGKKYALPIKTAIKSFKINDALEEHRVWGDIVSPLLEGAPKNVFEICNYGFTEIFNNAKEHSEGTTVEISVASTVTGIVMIIDDNGVGIFRKIKKKYDLADEREAILELSKGRATTDPKQHTGEGVFFTSRAFDWFEIESWRLRYNHFVAADDWLMEDLTQSKAGTKVSMRISLQSPRLLADIFNQFAGPESYDFSKTHVPVAIAQYGHDMLVSRSQAKRVLSRFSRFKEVLLDFNHVEFIGQAFADEIFRVFANEHPEVELKVARANEQVLKMISRAKAAKASDSENNNK